jgi:hypothetical protein
VDRDHPSFRGIVGVRSTTLEKEHFERFLDKEKDKSLKRLK